MSLLDRIRERCEQSDGCWLWRGCMQANGYGRIRHNGKTDYVHRLVFRLVKGGIPEGMDVCHTCDRRACCEPSHLFLGTRADNMRDAKAKGRLSAGAKHAELICGEKGASAKLTLRQVRAIRYAIEVLDIPKTTLAEIAGVTVDNIRRIARGNTWRDESKCAA